MRTDRTYHDAKSATTAYRLRTGALTLNVALAALAALAAAVGGGCSPDAYRRSADRDVFPILRDRTRTTLGYSPDAFPREVSADFGNLDARPRTVADGVTSGPIDRRPLTVTPGDAAPADPLEPDVLILPPQPLGPDADDLRPAPPGTADEPPREALGGAGGAATRLTLDRLAYGPVLDTPPGDAFGLFDAIRYAVANGFDYRDRAEAVYLAALNVTLQRHLLSPRPFAGVGATIDGTRLRDDVGRRVALSTVADAGVRQRLPYGGEVVAQALVRFVDAIDGNVTEGESAELALRGSIPLLRGAGLVNLEGLIDSERQLVYEIRAFEAFRRTYSVEVATRYFGLLVRQQAIRNRLLRFQNAAALLDRTEALFAAGRVRALEVQRSEQQLLSAEEALNQTQEAYESALDNFKLFIDYPVDEPLEIVPEAVAVPDIDASLLGRDGDGVLAAAALDLGLRYRLDLQTARDRVIDARRAVRLAENGLLPDLRLLGDLAVSNDADSPGRRLDGDTLGYSAGVRLDLPIDRLAERNTYRRTLLAANRLERDAADAADRVRADIRAAARAIRSAGNSLEIQRRSIEVARRRLELANDFLALGLSENSRDVVEAQNALLQAQDGFEQAQADLQTRILVFLRDTGALRVDPAAGTLGAILDLADPTRRGQ